MGQSLKTTAALEQLDAMIRECWRDIPLDTRSEGDFLLLDIPVHPASKGDFSLAALPSKGGFLRVQLICEETFGIGGSLRLSALA